MYHEQDNAKIVRYKVATSPSTAQLQAPKQPGRWKVWQQFMFYLHFLAFTLFFFIRRDFTAQVER